MELLAPGLGRQNSEPRFRRSTLVKRNQPYIILTSSPEARVTCILSAARRSPAPAAVVVVADGKDAPKVLKIKGAGLVRPRTLLGDPQISQPLLPLSEEQQSDTPHLTPCLVPWLWLRVRTTRLKFFGPDCPK